MEDDGLRGDGFCDRIHQGLRPGAPFRHVGKSCAKRVQCRVPNPVDLVGVKEQCPLRPDVEGPIRVLIVHDELDCCVLAFSTQRKGEKEVDVVELDRVWDDEERVGEKCRDGHSPFGYG